MIKQAVMDGMQPEPATALAYLHDMTAEMRDMASDLGFPLIVYLLQMAALEILATIERDGEPERAD